MTDLADTIMINRLGTKAMVEAERGITSAQEAKQQTETGFTPDLWPIIT